MRCGCDTCGGARAGGPSADPELRASKLFTVCVVGSEDFGSLQGNGATIKSSAAWNSLRRPCKVTLPVLSTSRRPPAAIPKSVVAELSWST